MLQHRAAAGLLRIEPVAALGAAGPGALERFGRQTLDFRAAFLRTVMTPHRIDIAVRRQRARQLVGGASDDVQRAARQIGRIQHLVQVDA